MKKLVAAVVGLLAVGPRGAPARAGDSTPAALLAVDTEFARATAARGLEGWLSYFADDATIFPRDAPITTGKASIRAAGFARYGASTQAGQIFSALFDTSQSVDDHRLPELFCGFPRQLQHGPVPYPVACKPQAWAAGSVFLLLQAALGLRVDAWERRVTFERVTLPSWLNELSLRGLQVGDARVDLYIVRGRWSAAVDSVGGSGGWDERAATASAVWVRRVTAQFSGRSSSMRLAGQPGASAPDQPRMMEDVVRC